MKNLSPLNSPAVSLPLVLALSLWLFTVHCSLPTVLLAQQPQTFVKQAGSGLAATVATFPNLNIAAGSVLCRKATVSYAGGQVTTLQSGINYVYFNCGSRTPQSNTSGFRGGEIPLAIVVARGGSYGPSGLLDVRQWAVTGAGTNGPHIRNNQAATGGPILFETGGGAEKMRVDTSGNVGIGTTTPGYPLDVNGQPRYTGSRVFYTTAGESGQTFLEEFGTPRGGGTKSWVLRLSEGPNSGTYWDPMKLSRTSDNSGNVLLAQYAGKVGIGTASPALQLQVNKAMAGGVYPTSGTSWSINPSNGNIQQFACGTGGATVTVSISTSPPLVKGELVTLVFVQNGTTACSVSWPTISPLAVGHMTINSTTAPKGTISVQQFVVSNNGTDLYAVAAGSVGMSGGNP